MSGKLPQDLTGMRFSRLFVICRVSNIGTSAAWQCTCDCGRETITKTHMLKSGRTKSCGCLSVETAKATHTTHGKSRSQEYSIFAGAKSRCVNTSHEAYKDYGGRGIEFRFNSFEEFYRELGPRPKNHTLERISVDGHYEPGNVKWATWSEQFNNKRCSVRVTIGNETKTVAEWSRHYGIPRNRPYYRLKNGWCPVCAITHPPEANKPACTCKREHEQLAQRTAHD